MRRQTQKLIKNIPNFFICLDIKQNASDASDVNSHFVAK